MGLRYHQCRGRQGRTERTTTYGRARALAPRSCRVHRRAHRQSRIRTVHIIRAGDHAEGGDAVLGRDEYWRLVVDKAGE